MTKEILRPEGSLKREGSLKPYCHYRYQSSAIKADGEHEEIWVANGQFLAELEGDSHWKIRYLAPPDEISEHVLNLNGAYGTAVLSRN